MNSTDIEVKVKQTGETLVVSKQYYEQYKDLFETKQAKAPAKNKMATGSKSNK